MSAVSRSSASEMTLTRPIARAGKSPRTPAAVTPGGSIAPAHTQYVSFPTPAQMGADGAVPPVVAARAASVSEAELDAAAKEKAAPTDRRSLAYSIFTFLLSSPALLGACCWPSIVAAVVGGSVTGGARVLSHTISFVVTLVVMLLMIAYFAYCTRTRAQLQSTHLGVYGPLYLLTLAALLVMADPLRHVLQNSGVWSGPSSNAFRDGCGEGWGCLTTTGILFMGVFTYLGFVLMFLASAWNGNLLAKLRLCARRIGEIRAAHAERELIIANQRREEAARAKEEELARLEALRARQRAIAASVAATTPSFGAMHLSMAPPTFVYRTEGANQHSRLGQLTSVDTRRQGASSNGSSSNRAAKRDPASPHASLSKPEISASSTSSTRALEYSQEGYSFEVKSPGIAENVIRVSPTSHAHRYAQQAPGSLSPTVTSSPSSSSRSPASAQLGLSGTGDSHGPYPSGSPMSTNSSSLTDVALTPASRGSKESPCSMNKGAARGAVAHMHTVAEVEP